MSAVTQNCVVQASTNLTVDGEVFNFYDDPQAPVHMLVGNAGATFSMNAYPVNPPWCEDVQNFYGYNVITAVNASYLTWVSYNTNQNDDEAIMDRIVVTQNVTNLGLDGWVLPASTEECITLQNAGPSAKKPFTERLLYSSIVIGLSSALVVTAMLLFLYRIRRNAMKRGALSSSSKSDGDGENYWKKRGIESVNGDTCHNPLVMNIN